MMRDGVRLLDVESEGIRRGRLVGFRETICVCSVKCGTRETLAGCCLLVVGFLEEYARKG